MLLNCANPKCNAEFLYLYEGEVILIELPDRSVQRYWLCGACASSMRVVYDPVVGIKIVPKDVQSQQPPDSETDCDGSFRNVA